MSDGRQVRGREQAFALLALFLTVLLVGVVAVVVASNLGSILLAVLGLGMRVGGGWWLISERMPRRAVGLVGVLAGVGLLVAAVLVAADERDSPLRQLLVIAGLAAGADLCARLAVLRTLRQLDLASVTRHVRPTRPVLIVNPKSGGGKVARFDLVERATALGVEVVTLEPDSDLEQLARDAVARGADCLGMAGGDGSQALVASVAIEHDLPFVCISAGTRNHFALDLGLDRDDPAAGLVAFTEGVLRQVDYARVNGRLFVNNASLGVYAEVVEQDQYREAKLETTASILPELLGARAEPFDLQFTTPDGVEVDGALLVLVSNNPYVLRASPDAAQRRSLLTGQLGVLAISSRTGRDAAALAARLIAGRAGRDPNLHEFTTGRLEVRSRSGSAPIGVDGESLVMPTPLTFTIHPAGLTLLVPPDNPREALTRHGYRALGFSGLLDIARGRAPHALEAVGLVPAEPALPSTSGPGASATP
jgi:diacylglycerol kinase family enzyme